MADHGSSFHARRAARPRGHLLSIPVLLGGLGAAAPALAQLAPETENVVVTATRTPQALSAVLPSVTVITRADIEASQSRDLAELLSRQAGIELARSGGQGEQTSIFMRGANSNQVLVLVDGVRINSVIDGAPDLGGISTDSIERIEIARGNLSSLYGSEAIGGVIQIFTRASDKPGAQAMAEAGQGQTRDASATLTAPIADTHLTVSAGYRSQQAISAIDVAQVPYINPSPDANHNRNGAVRWEERDSDGEVRLWAWGQRNDTGWDDPFNFSAVIPTDQIAQVEHRTQDGIGLFGARRIAGSLLSLDLAQTSDNAVNVSNVPNTDPYTDADNSAFLSRTRQLKLQDTTRLAPGIDVDGGYEHLDQNGSFTSFDFTDGANALTEATRRVDSLWAGTTGRVGSQLWQANVRHDGYSDEGSATTGLVGWGWAFDPAWKLTAQASTAFRAPSFQDLYYPGYGNPLLKPERARSEELGLRWERGGASAGLAAFRNRISDLIEGLAPSFRSINIAQAALDGGEAQAAGAWGGLRLGGSVSLDRPRDMQTGQPLLRRAHYAVKISASYVQGKWSAAGDWQRTGARDDIGILSGAPVQLAPYDLARVALAYAVNRHIKLRVRVENLFNSGYQLVDGYNTLPRMAIFGVEGNI